MNKMLVMGLMALAFSSCQSESGKKENVIIPTPTGVPSATIQHTPAGQKPAKNPAHGEPFHDCAVPVGAAFSADALPAQPKATTADLQPEIQQQPAPLTKEVKLNPAHGAPGHKCEVAVGAPLS